MSIALLLDRLSRAYPNATYALNWTSPEQLLIGAILAAQTTDERVNQVTPALFHTYPSIAALAAADRSALETLLQPTGYYRRKAATVQAVCQALVDRFGGKVPPRMADLVQLPGVGRKTANVVLNCAFNQPSGIIIDTHGIRVNRRLGLTAKTQADAIETDLMAQIPQESWIQWGNAIILHGRAVCQAKTPRCHACDLRDLCPQVGVQGQATTGSQQLGLLDLESLELESSEPGSLELGLTDRSGQTSNTQPNPKFQQQPSQQPNPKSQQQSNPKSQQQFSQQPNPRSQQQPSQQPNPKSQQQPSQQPNPKSQQQPSQQPNPKSQQQPSQQPSNPVTPAAQPTRTALGLDSWQNWIGQELEKPYFSLLQDFIHTDRQQHTIFPPPDQVFRAFCLTPPDRVRVLILGQDPYHGPDQAQGLAFSVPEGLTLPPSLRNIFKELAADLGAPAPQHGDLSGWARQGVLLLNAVLTVRQGEANSHKNQGWEQFTDAVIQAISDRTEHTVFILWGAYARRKHTLIDARHTLLTSAHPSPLSARHGFFGSRPFSQTNQALQNHDQEPIRWLS